MQGAEIVELIGDLGSGKTTLVQGLLSGLGYDGEAPSPTFTLSRVYKLLSGLELHHFDLYRLAGHDLVSDELEEVAGSNGVVLVVEWADHGASQLPKDRVTIKLAYGEDVNCREITVLAGGSKSQKLIEGLKDVLSA